MQHELSSCLCTVTGLRTRCHGVPGLPRCVHLPTCSGREGLGQLGSGSSQSCRSESAPPAMPLRPPPRVGGSSGAVSAGAAEQTGLEMALQVGLLS